MTENMMVSWDRTELFYRAWKPKRKTDKAIILFHRGHEHSGRWQDVIDKLDLPSFNFFAWDARGHGRSPGERGYAETYGCLVKDVDSFVRHVSLEHGIPYENIIVLAHSVGSVLVSTWVHDFAAPVRALVLGSPAFRVRLYAPFAVPTLRLLLKVRGKASISSYVKGRLLTHDPAKIRSYDNDPLITPNISVNILLGLHDAATRLMLDAGAITLPVLILTSGADFVVKQSAQRRFYDRLSNIRKEMQTFPGFFHDTFNEKDNHHPIAKARLFIQDVFRRELETVDLLDADKAGYTKDEFDRLSEPLAPLSVKRLKFGLARLFLNTLGRLSEGIRIGWRSGFDSGSTLDYVYRNQARGFALIGKLIDRAYLDSPGWTGIRQRKINLETLLNGAIEMLHEQGKEIRIVDIAAGHGRYVLDAIKSHHGKSVSALLRDFDENNVQAGRVLANQLGLDQVVYEKGDAFNPDSLEAISNKPNIAIVSGLFELFVENGPVRVCLAGLHKVTEKGGYLIYTNQPWHPQLEFIARTLTSHRGGEAWVMRRRTQQEMDQMIADAGFVKIAMEIDDSGIFSVSLARKVQPEIERDPISLDTK